MKTFPAAFNIEKNKSVGAKPIWILKLTINSISYWLSSKRFIVPEFITSLPWPQLTVIKTIALVKSWGSIQQGITNWLSEFQVSELSVNLLLKDPIETSTNLILKSNTFSTSPWTIIGTGTIAQGATDPLGGLTAWTLDDTSSTSMYGIYQNVATSIYSKYTISIWCKKQISLTNSLVIKLINGGLVRQIIFNPETGVFVNEMFSEVFDYEIATLVGNFWKIELGFTTTLGENAAIYIYPAGNTDGSSMLSNATQGSQIIYQAQVVQKEYAVDDIITLAEPITRSAVASLIDLETLLLTYPIEDQPAELYEWFVGCTDPPQRLFSGYVRDISNVTDLDVNLSIQDSTIKLEKHYVGTKLTQASYPTAASADIGKVIPIPFGTVSKCPSVVLAGYVQTTLTGDVTLSATSFNVSDVTGIAIGQVYLIDSEQVYVTGVTGGGAALTKTLQISVNSATTAFYLNNISGIVAGQIYSIDSEKVLVNFTTGGSALITDTLILDILITDEIIYVTNPSAFNYAGICAIDSEQVFISGGIACSFQYTLFYARDAVNTIMYFSTTFGGYAGEVYEADGEWIKIVSISGTTATVVRGYNGTTAVPHLAGTIFYQTDGGNGTGHALRVLRGMYGTSITTHSVGAIISTMSGPSIGVTRGYSSTTAASHSAGATLIQDFGTGVYINVSRHYNSTTAVAHTKGTALVQLTTQTYCCSDRSLTAISKVWLRMSEDNDMDISSYCTKYPTNNLPTYSKSGITITSSQMVSILNIIGLKQSDTIAVSSSNLSVTEATANGPQVSQGAVSGYGTKSVYGIFNNTEPNNRSRITLTVDALFESSFTYDAAINLCSSPGNRINTLWSENNISGARAMNFSVDIIPPYSSYNCIEAVIGSNNVYISVRLNGCTRVITQTASSATTTGARVDKTGSAQLTGSAMTTYFGSGKVFMDIISDKGNLVDISDYILDDANFTDNVSIVGTLPTMVYAGVINEYLTSLWWLNHLGFQSQAWFTIINGLPKLVSRNRNIIDKVIPACKITEDGQRVLTRRKTDVSEIINKINLLYNRDWSKSKGDTSYKSNLLLEDSTSQTTYGLKEQSELFQFDFMTSATDATNVSSFYISNYKDRHWIAEFDIFLDHSEIEFGDCVQLGFIDTTTKGIVISASHTPGSYTQIDTVHLTVLIF